MSDENAQITGAPRDPVTSLRQGVRRVVGAQALSTVGVAAVFAFHDGSHAALSAAYGGAITILITVWLGWRLQRVGARTAGLGTLFSGTVLRYAAAIALLALGLGAWKLAPLPLLIAFGLAQFGFLANAHRR